MIKGDFIRIVLSCGIKEEGIIDDPRLVEDGETWIFLAHKNNPDIKLHINKKYIAAHQIENIKLEEPEIKTLVVDDLSLNEPIVDPKLRMKKLAELTIVKSNMEREQFKKIIKNK